MLICNRKIIFDHFCYRYFSACMFQNTSFVFINTKSCSKIWLCLRNQKQHFNIWSNILQLLDNHIIAYFLLYAAYKNDFLISSFSSFSVSYPSVPSVFWRVSFVIFFLQIYIECNTMLPLEVYCKTYVDAWCSEVNITFVSTIFCTIRPLVQNLI